MRRISTGLLAFGTAVTILGLSKAHAVAHAYDYTASPRLAWSLTYLGFLIVAAYAVGLPDLAGSHRSAVAAAVLATAAAATGVSVFQLALGSALLPRVVVFVAPALLVPFYVLCAALAGDGRARAAGRERLVLVGDPAEAVRLADELAADAEKPAVLVLALTSGGGTGGPGSPDRLLDAVRTAGATTVVLDRAAQADETIVAQAARVHEQGVRVRTLSLLYEQCLGKLPLSELERVALLFDIGELHQSRYGRVKRVIDVLAATAGLVVLALVTPAVLVGNAVANRGPLVYRQRRVGKRGKEFAILKFRTMAPSLEETSWTQPDDPRVTRFGRWLRRSHLDELPQVVNILKGDLSVVGPRPEQPAYVEELNEKIRFYGLRHLVRPGLTGWAQVKYPYGANESDAFEKLQYDFYYLRHQSLALDARIIARTVRAVVGRRGR